MGITTLFLIQFFMYDCRRVRYTYRSGRRKKTKGQKIAVLNICISHDWLVSCLADIRANRRWLFELRIWGERNVMEREEEHMYITQLRLLLLLER
jgi:hypothetical protein